MVKYIEITINPSPITRAKTRTPLLTVSSSHLVRMILNSTDVGLPIERDTGKQVKNEKHQTKSSGTLKLTTEI